MISYVIFLGVFELFLTVMGAMVFGVFGFSFLDLGRKNLTHMLAKKKSNLAKKKSNGLSKPSITRNTRKYTNETRSINRIAWTIITDFIFLSNIQFKCF
jgi:hypothetical protein